jgi:predicted metalloprotease with PDZ domain
LSGAVYGGQVHYAAGVMDRALTVQATVRHAPVELELVFASAAWGVTGLERRITDLEVVTVTGEPVYVVEQGMGVYGLRLTQPDDLIVRYRVQPSMSQWDHHLTMVTENHLQLTADAFFQLRDPAVDERPAYPTGTLELALLPESWTILPYHTRDDQGFFTLSDELVIQAGMYHLRQVTLGQSSFTLAFHQNFTPYLPLLRRMDAVLQFQYALFGDYQGRDALVVLNPLSGSAKDTLYAGRALPGLAVLYTQMKKEMLHDPHLLLTRLAHETFHLWLAQSFTLYEGMYWFTEGFARYHEYQVLRDLELVDADTSLRFLAEEWVAAARAQQHAAISLQKAGAYLFADPPHRVLAYAKGALIAYLFEQQLPGKTLAGFYQELYREYAGEGQAIGNREIITLMNEHLGDTTFTQKWILESSRLSLTDLPELLPYAFAAWLAALPDIALEKAASFWGLLGLCGVALGMYIGTKPKKGT